MPHPHEAITLTPEQARDEEHKVLIRAVYRIAEKVERLSKTAADVDALKARYRRDVNREALYAIERLAELDPEQLRSLLQRYQS